jgi:hypothetical protein
MPDQPHSFELAKVEAAIGATDFAPHLHHLPPHHPLHQRPRPRSRQIRRPHRRHGRIRTGIAPRACGYWTILPSAGVAGLEEESGALLTCQPLLVLVRVTVAGCGVVAARSWGKAVWVSAAAAQSGTPVSV